MGTFSDSIRVIDHGLRARLCISCGHQHVPGGGTCCRCRACGWRYRPDRQLEDRFGTLSGLL